MRYYIKRLDPGRIAPYTYFKWPEPGSPLTAYGTLVPCVNGLHLTHKRSFTRWEGQEIWIAAAPDDVEFNSEDDAKTVVREAELVVQLTGYTTDTYQQYVGSMLERLRPFEPAPGLVDLMIASNLNPGNERTINELANARATQLAVEHRVTREDNYLYAWRRLISYFTSYEGWLQVGGERSFLIAVADAVDTYVRLVSDLGPASFLTSCLTRDELNSSYFDAIWHNSTGVPDHIKLEDIL